MIVSKCYLYNRRLNYDAREFFLFDKGFVKRREFGNQLFFLQNLSRRGKLLKDLTKIGGDNIKETEDMLG